MDASARRFVLLAGDIGTGKTGLASSLAEAIGARQFLENVDENPFFARFYEEPARWAFASQVSFVAARLRDQIQALDAGPLVQDRSAFEAVDVFGRVLREHGHLSAEEFEVLRSLRRCAEELPRQPTHLVYLHAPTSVLLERIAARGREPEQQITAGYLEELDAAHEEFVASWDSCPVVRVDSATVDLRGEGLAEVVAAVSSNEGRTLL